jgi:glycosyltransferase involved in cell wall biosynthesis
MKIVRISILWFLAFIIPSLWATHDIEFVILVTSYNNEKYVTRNLDSIVCQRSSKPFQIICVNDGSSDRTGQLMDDYAKSHGLTEPFLKIIHNKKRFGSALENIYNTVHTMIPDNKIVVCIDGDDTLSFGGVLARLEKEYADPDVWMTYGRFVVTPKGEFWTICGGYPEEVILSHSFRQHYNVPSHLKTFKASLFKKIKRTDLLDPEGNIYRKAWDMAMLFPMLEMCAPKGPQGKNHSRFIADTVLYVYNYDNPIGDSRTDAGRQEQIKLDRHIRSLPPYKPLDHL